MDLIQRVGKYPLPPQAPKILGVEFSGTVESLGDGTDGFKKGDPVFGLAYGGVYTPSVPPNDPLIRVHRLIIQRPMLNSWLFPVGCASISLKASLMRKQLVFPNHGLLQPRPFGLLAVSSPVIKYLVPVFPCDGVKLLTMCRFSSMLVLPVLA